MVNPAHFTGLMFNHRIVHGDLAVTGQDGLASMFHSQNRGAVQHGVFIA
jgi:hypothetical protein